MNDIKVFETSKLPNTANAYQNMIDAFCSSGGSSHTKASEYISNQYPKKDFSSIKSSSIFDTRVINFEQIDVALKEHGYYILPQRLETSYVEQLYALALAEPATIRLMDGQSSSTPGNMEKIDLEHPKSIIYTLPEHVLINHELVQKIVGDYVFLNIAQNYLGTEPIWDVTSLWWSTNASKKSDKNAAQWFHFDMDRIKWLKVFIYLTDVNSDNGPHTFIDGSSKDGNIPKSLLAKGYKRLSDEEVARSYSSDKYVEFKAPKGTIILEDTRGLHKGKNVTGDPRCLLQFQYSNSLFGAAYPKTKIKEVNNDFIERMGQVTSRLLSNYL